MRGGLRLTLTMTRRDMLEIPEVHVRHKQDRRVFLRNLHACDLGFGCHGIHPPQGLRLTDDLDAEPVHGSVHLGGVPRLLLGLPGARPRLR